MTAACTQPLYARSARQLATAIATGQVSSSDVVESVIRRIEALEPCLHAVTVPRFEEARRAAVKADEQVRAGETLGPLHGVPITVKDAYAVVGTVSTVGLTNRDAAAPASADAPPVKALRDAGAIVVAKTNVPQLMFCHECDNPRYGRTSNPWNLDRTPGGSSGGEAALIAAGGAPLGLGSDLGGSIRVPCHFCGLSGIKPTSGRLSTEGHFRTLRGMSALSFQPGPMARTVGDVELAYDVLLCAAAQARSVEDPRKTSTGAAPDVAQLRIGVCESHSFFPAAPPIVRAIHRASEALTHCGSQLESFVPRGFAECVGCYLAIMSADGGADLRRLLRGSRVQRGMRQTLFLSRLPQAIRQPMAVLLACLGQELWAFALKHSGPRSADALWRQVEKRNELRQAVLDQLDERGLDAVIMPVHGLPAFPHGRSQDLLLPACYAYWANLLELPAGTVPVTRVHAEETQSNRVTGVDVVKRLSRDSERNATGLPLGVQVVARPWREDVVFTVMRAIEGQVNFDVEPLRRADW